MSYVEANLMQGEQVVYQTSLHWLLYSWPIVLAIVGLLMLLGVPALGLVVLVLAAILGATVFITVHNAEFAVTDKRVIMKTGWINRRSLELLLSKIESIAVDQGLAGKLWGYGTIVLSGTGGSHEPFKNIADPFEFRKQVQEQIARVQDAAITSRANPSAANSSARVERECPYCAEMILAKAKICKHCGKEVEPLVL
ncbi:MAG: PH domain-containing protein [Gammaproteobacteria bacterium]